MNTRITISIILVSLGLLIAAVPEDTTKPFKLSSQQLLEEMNSGVQFISSDEIADMIIKKDPSLRLIDVRTPDEFEVFSLSGAINIPISDILSPEWEGIVDQDVKINVLYSNGTLYSNQAWSLLRQLGYNNNYVLQGGLNYWMETILNPGMPSSLNPDDEFAKYDFRKAASMALGGGSLELQQNTSQTKTKTTKPIIRGKKKKKRAAGGC